MVRFLINRPIAVTMTLIAILTLGFLAMKLIPISLMPDVKVPQITVQVSSPNLSARQIDRSVIQPLRSRLAQVSHLRDIRTESQDGTGSIFMQFDYGSDIDFIFIDVNEKIDRSMQLLSRNIERPRVMKASATDIPAFYLNLSLKDTVDKRRTSYNFPELSRFASSIIAKRFEQLPEVAMVDVSGHIFSELVVNPDMRMLESLGITAKDLENAIKSKQIELGNLIITDGQYQYNIRFSSTLVNKQDVENVYLSINDKVYQLKDLATVKQQPRRREGMIRSDGKEAITMAIVKQSSARMENLKQNVSELVQVMQQENPNIDFKLTRDQTALLDYSIGNLESNLLTGILLACIVIFLFMQDFRSPLLITFAIPVSLIVSILFMYIFGITINIISLSGLVLGVGMMVDNSIIVIDNISQRWDRGESLEDAVVRGTNEVFAPMLSSVLTTCSVFIPLIFMSNIAGELFFDQAMAVTIGLLSSLGVAVVAIPVYYYLAYRKENRRRENKFLKKLNVINYEKIYETGLKWTMRHQGIVWTLILAMLCGTVWLFRVIDKNNLPDMTQEDMLVNVAWNEFINVSENDRRISALMSSVEPMVAEYTSMVGKQQFILSHTKENLSSESVIYVKSVVPSGIDSIRKSLERYVGEHYPEAVLTTERSGNIFDMIFTDNESPLVARIQPEGSSGLDPEKLSLLLADIRRELPDQYFDPIEWQEIIVMRSIPQLMTLYDIDFNDLNHVLQVAFNENIVLSLQEGEYSLPIVVGDGNDTKTIRDVLDGVTVRSPSGVVVPVSSLMREGREKDLKILLGGQEGEYYPLNFDIPDSKVQEVMKTTGKVVRDNKDFGVRFTGSYFSNREMIGELMIILTISVLLLYFILASQFESLIQPFIILSEIAIDLFGALILLWLCGSSLNIMSMIGMVVMCGIVINDSILKVDTINKLRKQGYELKRAIMMGGNRRLKPIIMTSLTTILAIAPFLVTGSMGADLQFPLSLAIIGGMTLGTVVSVFFIPLLYYYIYKPRKK